MLSIWRKVVEVLGKSALVSPRALFGGLIRREIDCSGYLYLQRRLEQGNELGLMLINTIRKVSHLSRARLIGLGPPLDFCIEHPPGITYYHQDAITRFKPCSHTHTGIKSAAEAQAVSPSIRLDYHVLLSLSPAVRQRSIQALIALYIVPGSTDFPLSMSKIVKMLSMEEDDSVLLALVRTLRVLLEVSRNFFLRVAN
jgi:hypothetical protein